MALFTTNRKAAAFIKTQKFFATSSFIILFLWLCLNIYFSLNNREQGKLLFLSFPVGAGIVLLAFAGKAYYDFIRIPSKCNHFIQSVEYDGGRIKLRTFPFRVIMPPRDLKAIEFTFPQNKLEIRKSNIWSQFSEREVFIIMHEGEKYCLAPYYFDDFDTMVKTIPFVKIP